MDPNDVCAVILAGGQSRRMGCNKALLEIEGKPLIQLLIDRIRPVTDQILVSSNDSEAYKFLDFPVVPDHFPGHGPLAGFHAAMTRKVCPLYIVLACDLPNLRTPFLQNLISMAEGYDAAIPLTQDGVAHPLCAIYRRTCLPPVQRALEEGNYRVIETFIDNGLSIRWIRPDEGKFKDTDLANINRPEDLRKVEKHAGSESGPLLNM
jgi:molybdenum cofactor guanylyltransferase